jgi:hypothetical protein
LHPLQTALQLGVAAVQPASVPALVSSQVSLQRTAMSPQMLIPDTVQYALQVPVQSDVFPSSQASPASWIPLPHTAGLGAQPEHTALQLGRAAVQPVSVPVPVFSQTSPGSITALPHTPAWVERHEVSH